MKRLVLYPLLVAAAVVPAVTGLLGNASFSQDVPVRTPPRAQLLDDDGPRPTGTPTSASPTHVPSARPTHDAGDDHGGDRSRTSTRTTGPGDDHGGDRSRTSTRTTDPDDDHGGDRSRTSTRTTEPGDDHGDDHGGDRHRGSADSSPTSDDESGHGSHAGRDSGGHGSDD